MVDRRQTGVLWVAVTSEKKEKRNFHRNVCCLSSREIGILFILCALKLKIFPRHENLRTANNLKSFL